MNATLLNYPAALDADPFQHGSKTAVAPIDGVAIHAELFLPPDAHGLAIVILAHDGISEPEQVDRVARAMAVQGVATLALALFTQTETDRAARMEQGSFELDLSTHRLLQATSWALRQPRTRELGIGFLSTGWQASAAFIAAAQLGYAVEAVVSCAGRPDLAGNLLARVTAPTLLIVGDSDGELLAINSRAYKFLAAPKQFIVMPGKAHLLAEVDTFEPILDSSARWFSTHLKPILRT
ncbi:MAG: alpha/beta hydrolase [Opitutus sp.]